MVGGLWPSGGGPRALSLPRRRREAPLELGVLARSFLQMRRAGPRALLGLGLERVLLAGVLCCFRGVTGGFCWRYGCVCGFCWTAAAMSRVCGVRRAVSARERLWAGPRGETSRRASGALTASRDVFVSPEKFRASRSASDDVAALVCVQNPRGD